MILHARAHEKKKIDRPPTNNDNDNNNNNNNKGTLIGYPNRVP